MSQADRSPVGGAYARYLLGALVVVYIFNFLDRQILAILAPRIKADFGISDACRGFLYGTAFAVFFALFGLRARLGATRPAESFAYGPVLTPRPGAA